MPERDAVERDAAGPDAGPDAGEAQVPGAREVSSADSMPAMVLLFPALLLLRFLGDNGWAYGAAAVLGALGLIAAGFGMVSAVGSLRRGRRRLVAVYTLLLLLGASFVLVARLVENA
ncbi:hypothetical protein ABZZ17_15115 [Streptomyces sp. NPDC006512]|uniref:hypothetical protein n=1 Tax=Streptomyces sp. NPDC006512 TaxID=3154307 RepID=UPI0033A23773